jgi:murein DD-endopeptidase MepM/ murein hydrolase activator NlpD
LKRAHLRKDKSVSCFCQATVDAVLEQSEVSAIGAKRRVRSSAAMIGLALSMGATGALLPRQDDGAAAAEPRVPDIAVAAIPVASTGSASALQPSAVSSVRWVEHIVRDGQTIQQVASQYRVNGMSIAIANGLTLDATLRAGQVLRVPVTEGNVSGRSINSETIADASRSSLVASANLEQASGLSTVGTSSGSQIDSTEGNNRDTALEHLRQQRDKLRESLAELRYEEPGLVASASKLETEVAQQERAGGAQSNTLTGAAEERVALHPLQSNPPQVNPLPGIPFIAPDAVPSSERQSDRPTVAVNLDSQPEPIQPQMSLQPSVYRVNPGDTVAAIARAHNVPQSLLIEMNGLSNPNVIFVGQVLSVPTQPAQDSVIPETSSSFTIADASVASETMQPDVPTPFVTGESTLIPGAAPTIAASPVVPQLPSIIQQQSTSEPEALSLAADSEEAQSEEVQEDEIQISASPFANPNVESPAGSIVPNSEPSFTPDTSTEAASEANPYVTNLLTEIRALRQRQQPVVTAASTISPGLETATIAVPTLPDASTGEAAVNPNMPQRDEAAQNEEIRPISTSLPDESSSDSSQPELVAAAPLGSESYDPLLQPVTGRMVSPDLPPLPGADTFLPDAGGVFNGFIWPARGILTSGYGWRWGRMHRGIDIAADVGTPIYAAATGVIEFAGWNSGGYGNMVEIRHPDGSMTRYAHMNAIHVRNGQNVSQGDQLGEMGSTGYSTGPHLHFEVHIPAQGTVNPLAYLPASR